MLFLSSRPKNNFGYQRKNEARTIMRLLMCQKVSRLRWLIIKIELQEQRNEALYLIPQGIIERVGLAKEKSSSTTSGGLKGGQHLGRKEEKEAYIAYN